MGKYFKFLIIFIIFGALNNFSASVNPKWNKRSENVISDCQELAKDNEGNEVCLGDIYEDPVEYKCMFCNRITKCKKGFMKDLHEKCREVLKLINPSRQNKL